MYKYKGDLTGKAIVSIPSVFSQESQRLFSRRDLTTQRSNPSPPLAASPRTSHLLPTMGLPRWTSPSPDRDTVRANSTFDGSSHASMVPTSATSRLTSSTETASQASTARDDTRNPFDNEHWREISARFSPRSSNPLNRLQNLRVRRISRQRAMRPGGEDDMAFHEIEIPGAAYHFGFSVYWSRATLYQGGMMLEFRLFIIESGSRTSGPIDDVARGKKILALRDEFFQMYQLWAARDTWPRLLERSLDVAWIHRCFDRMLGSQPSDNDEELLQIGFEEMRRARNRCLW